VWAVEPLQLIFDICCPGTTSRHASYQLQTSIFVTMGHFGSSLPHFCVNDCVADGFLTIDGCWISVISGLYL